MSSKTVRWSERIPDEVVAEKDIDPRKIVKIVETSVNYVVEFRFKESQTVLTRTIPKRKSISNSPETFRDGNQGGQA